MRLVAAVVAGLVGSASARASLNSSLPDCVCMSRWENVDGLCSPASNFSTFSGVRMHGCPALATIQLCDVAATKSYCYTTQDTCKQQVGSEMVGEGWAYCDPVTAEPELPPCTCKSRWQNTECVGGPKWMSGCPTVEEMQQCDPSFDGDEQVWCDTNEELCAEQEDGPSEAMTGLGWAYCDPYSLETELPECECASSWTPSAGDCNTGATGLTFSGCPAVDTIRGCDTTVAADDAQSWCKTTRTRCREQTVSATDSNEDMRGDGWAYCSPTSGDAELPECECLPEWNNSEVKCSDRPLTMNGCPSRSDLLMCEHTVDQTWCDTTYSACKEQNYEADDEGWAYCDTRSGEAELADCECEDRWFNREGDCAALSATVPGLGIKKGLEMRGCPTLDMVQACDASATQSWCDTKDALCKGQTGDAVGQGWMTCDHLTQGATPTESGEVAAAVAVSVVVTLVFVSLLLTAALMVLTARRRRQQMGFKVLVTEEEKSLYQKGASSYASNQAF